MGKSCFVLNIAANVAMQGKKVLYITLEDDRKYVVLRMLSRFADIDLTDLTLSRVPKDKWRDIIEAANSWSGKKPLWVEDTSGLTTSAIRQIVANHKMFHGLDLVIIDHLGEIGDEGKDDTSIITHGAKAIRNIAKDFEIPVLLACQLNREVERRPDKRPMLSDLKQSGKIEEASRVVWFLYRPGYYQPDGDDRRDLQLIIAKANHGKTGMLKHWVDLSRMYVRGWEPDKDGLFPGFKGSPGDAHESTRDRGRQNQGDFFDGSY